MLSQCYTFSDILWPTFRPLSLSIAFGCLHSNAFVLFHSGFKKNHTVSFNIFILGHFYSFWSYCPLIGSYCLHSDSFGTCIRSFGLSFLPLSHAGHILSAFKKLYMCFFIDFCVLLIFFVIFCFMSFFLYFCSQLKSRRQLQFLRCFWFIFCAWNK